MLANGPGDPAALDRLVGELRALVGRVPIFGICLGHQLLCRAVGLETYKLRFGHRGANHPVKDLETGRIEITSQNHGFAVLGPGGRAHDRGRPAGALGDRLRRRASSRTSTSTTAPSRGCGCREARASTVQYHPEAGPGPHDALHLFDRFIAEMRSRLMPRRDDIRRILDPRLGADRDRPGGRVRLLRRAGVQGARRGGLRGDPRQLQPGDDHDRPGVRDRRPTSSRCCRARCAQVIARERPDALLPTLGGQTALNLAKDAPRGRHARALRRRADRRQLRGDPPRRGPRPASARRCSRPGLRVPRSAIATNVARGARPRSRRSGCPRSCGPPSRSAARAAASRARARSTSGSSRPGSPPRRSGRSSSRSRCSAGASSSSR